MKPLVRRTKTVFANIINHTRQITTDLTVKFPVISNRENKYLFVLYDYDSSLILIRPMKSQSESKFARVFTDLHEHIIARGLNPAYTRLENESSPAFHRELKSKNIDFQLPPPPMNSYPQCSGTGNQHIQVSLYCRNLLNRPILLHVKLIPPG